MGRLHIGHLNVCSLRNKVDDVSKLLDENNLDILAISETHLDESVANHEIAIMDYCVYRKDRDNKGGGVAIYIKNYIPVKLRNDLMSPSIEMLWLEIDSPRTRSLLLGCCYRPPGENVKHLEKIYSILKKASGEDKKICCLGDFNIDWLSEKSLKNKLRTATCNCGLSQLVNEPSRVYYRAGRRSETCIDLIFTNVKEWCSGAESVCVGFSDHNLVTVRMKFRVHEKYVRSFDESDLIRDLKKVDWNRVCKIHDVKNATQLFMKLFLEVIHKHSSINPKSRKAPWLDEELEESMNKRDRIKEEAIKKDSAKVWKSYRKKRKQVITLNQRKKISHFKNRIKESEGDENELWRIIDDILGRSWNNTPLFIEADGTFISNPLGIAEYFKKKVEELREGMTESDNTMTEELSFQQVNDELVLNFLRGLKREETGLGDLDVTFLQLADYISLPICHILNLSLTEGVFPTAWKAVKVVPSPKNPKETFTCANSCSVSILHVLSELMEIVVFDQISRFFTKNKLISELKYADWKGDSTCTALKQMTDQWLSDINEDRMVGAVLLDFSSAFNLIDHEKLLKKLAAYGFSSSACKWMRSYLTDGTQQVVFNGHSSKARTVRYGVPQGGCLGPLLLSIFLNDMPLDSKKATMFAGDVILYTSSEDADELNKVLNNELSLISNWTIENNLVINASETKCMVFDSRGETEISLSINDAPIEKVSKARFLGVTLDEQLSWESHINETVLNMEKDLSRIKRYSRCFGKSLTQKVIEARVLSHLDNCSVTYLSAGKSQLRKLQEVQNKAARFAFCRSADINKIHTALGWKTVKERFSSFVSENNEAEEE